MPRYPSSEHRLIATLRRTLGEGTNNAYSVGIGDDAAVRQCRAGERLVLTADMLVEGVHFSLEFMSLEEVGSKAIAANLSDCAAMGARAESVLVQVAFPERGSAIERSVVQLYRGIRRTCRRWNVDVVGGDLSQSSKWVVDVTVVGKLGLKDRLLRRSGARAGDYAWVTGHPGESAAGLAALNEWGRGAVPAEFGPLVRRHVAPRPRMDEGRSLCASRTVHALMDLSDGLSKDCATMACESGVALQLDAAALTGSPRLRKLALRLGCDAANWALHGGEDYELLFAASPSFSPARCGIGRGLACTAIGRFSAGTGLTLRMKDGAVRPLACKAWDHLAR